VAVNLETGQEKWRSHLGDGWSPTTPTIYDSLVIAGSGDGQMLAVNRFTGQPAWKFQCQESIFAFSPYRTQRQALTGSPIVTGNVIYFGATDGFFYALNAGDGQLRWKFNLGAPVLSTPAVSGNALFIASFNGNIYCFIAENLE
jgi:outer membrane protein assembly factor BamB